MANHGGVDLDRSAETRLRVLQRHGQRLSLRLEEPFWHQLEECARDEGVALADLVFDLVSSAEETANRASLLRTYCVLWLRQGLVRARLASLDVDMALVMSACPSPCLIIAPDRRVIAYNPAFSRSVLKAETPRQGEIHETELALSFSQPYDQTLRKLAEHPDRILFSKIGFAGDALIRMRDVSYCLLNRKAAERSPVLAFVLGDR